MDKTHSTEKKNGSKPKCMSDFKSRRKQSKKKQLHCNQIPQRTIRHQYKEIGRRKQLDSEMGMNQNLAIDDQPTVLGGVVLRNFRQGEDLSVTTHLGIWPQTAEKRW